MLLFRCCFHDTLYFGHVDHREEFGKQQEGTEEETKCEQILTNVEHCGVEHRPARRQVIAVKRRYDDHKALEPHTDVHDDGEHKCCRQAGTNFLEPEQLRRYHVASHHTPVSPPVRTAHTIEERILFGRNLSVPCDEEFGDVSDTYD